MKTKTKRPQVAPALKKRIQEYYRHLNSADFQWCYNAIDPDIRNQATSIAFIPFALSLERFLNHFGKVTVKSADIKIELHQHGSNALYQDRDFAVIRVPWLDKYGNPHQFQDRWVRSVPTWYSRCTGLTTPKD
jgi:hypothetical protein